MANLRPCEHQVAGHLFEEGKAGSLVDDRGHFYKPIQPGPRGDREKAFYETIRAARAEDKAAWAAGTWNPAAVSAVQAIAAGGQLGDVLFGSNRASGASTTFPSPPLSPSFRSTPPRSTNPISVPNFHRNGGGMVHFPTFRAEPSFCQSSDLVIRDPIEVLERDELGLIDAIVVEELLQWSEEDGSHASSPALSPIPDARGGGDESGDLLYSQSPDSASDDGGEHATGKQVMDGVRDAHISHLRFSSAPGPLHRSGVGNGEMNNANTTEAAARAAETAGHTTTSHALLGGEEDSQAAVPVGNQPRWYQWPLRDNDAEEDQDQFSVPISRTAAESGTPLVPENGRAVCLPPGGLSSRLSADGENGSRRTSADLGPGSSRANAVSHHHPGWAERQLGVRTGTAASAMSTDSVEDALRLHALTIAARMTPSLLSEEPLRGGDAEGEKEEQHLVASGSNKANGPSLGVVTTARTKDCSEQDTINKTERAPLSPTSAAKTWNSMPFTVRNAPLLRVIPKFYGVIHADGRILLELEDLARWYRHPCIMDIKVGYRTWYPHADLDYIERCRRKDASTTQAALGFKICGMQVYRHARGGYWRASKRWCKTLPEVLVDKALTSFAHNEHGLRPADVYGGPNGAVAQLRSLEAWFQVQREFHLYSASLLILYEGDADGAESANVRVRLVDFAHTFKVGEGGGAPTASDVSAPSGAGGASSSTHQSAEIVIDENFLGGLRAIASRLTAVSRLDVADTLMAAERAPSAILFNET